MATAYSYIRFSSEKQASGDSLRRQLEQAREYCSEHNLILDEDTYRDLGLSAYKGKHLDEDAGLGKFLKACETGVVANGSFLIIESLDRLSRQHVQVALRQLLNILSYNITVVTLLDGQTYTSESDTTPLIISITIMARAHQESDMKSKRLKATWENKRTNANTKKMTATAPFWLTLTEDKSEFIINERVKALEVMFEMTVDGFGGRTITKYLNQHHPDLARNGKWSNNTIFNAVRNRSVLGEFQPHKRVPDERGVSVRKPVGEPIKDYYPQVISERKFLLAQKSVASRTKASAGRKGDTFSNLLTKAVTCAKCGSTFVMKKQYGFEPNRYQYLVCKRRLRSEEAETCDNAYVRYTDMEKFIILQLLKDEWSHKLVKPKRKEQEHDLSQLETDKLRAESNLSSFLAMTDDFSNVAVSNKFNQMKEEIKKLSMAIDQAKLDSVEPPKISLKEIWQVVADAIQEPIGTCQPTKLTPEKLYGRRQRLNSLIKETFENIVVDASPDKAVIHADGNSYELEKGYSNEHPLWFLANMAEA